MQTVQMQIGLLLSVLSASTLFDQVGLLAFKTFQKTTKAEYICCDLLSDPETQKLFLKLI